MNELNSSTVFLQKISKLKASVRGRPVNSVYKTTFSKGGRKDYQHSSDDMGFFCQQSHKQNVVGENFFQYYLEEAILNLYNTV